MKFLSLDEETRQGWINEAAAELIASAHEKVLEKYRSLDAFTACWIEDSTPRVFKDELIQSGKGHKYVGEWSPESNQWHGYGVAVYSN